MGKASKRKRRRHRHTEVKTTAESSMTIRSPGFISGCTFGCLLLIALAGLLAYSNTLSSPFQFDDFSNIKENQLIQDLDNFTSSLKGYSYNTRRFVGYFTFALNYHFGGLDVAGYHIVNLLIHIFNAILIYLFVILTFRTPFFNNPPTPPPLIKGGYILALFSALLFVSHPVQTQAVTYIVQRFTSLAALFYLLSIVTYIKGRLLSQSAESGAQGVTGKEKKHLALPLTFYFLSLLSAVCAMKTKEIAFTLPMTVILYEFSFFRTPLRKKLLFLLPILLTLVIIPLSIMNIDKPIGDILSDVSERTRLQTNIPRGDYIMTQMRVITTYIRLIFFPVNQNLDYDYPIYRSFLIPSVLLSFLFLLSILVVGLYLFYASRIRAKGRAHSAEDKSRESRLLSLSHLSPENYSLLPYYRLIGFGIFWFFITLSVESSVIPIVDVIFEHRVYLPSVGAFIAITTSVFLITRRLKSRWHAIDRTVISLLAIIVMVLAGTTYARNVVWQDEMSLWEDVVRKSPGKSRGYNDLGYIHLGKGSIERAIEHFQTAIKLNPLYNDAYNNLGVSYYSKGLTDMAIALFRKALELNPEFPDAHNNIGLVLRSQGDIDLAIEHFMTALKLKPGYPEAIINLGAAYVTNGVSDKAIALFRKALALNPEFPEAHNNLGLVLRSQGDIDLAIKHFMTALKLKPDYPEAIINLGVIYGTKGLSDKAIAHFRKALELNPGDPDAHNNLGVAFRSQGKIDQAIQHFRTALKLKPDYPSASKNLDLALRSKGQ